MIPLPLSLLRIQAGRASLSTFGDDEEQVTSPSGGFERGKNILEQGIFFSESRTKGFLNSTHWALALVTKEGEK